MGCSVLLLEYDSDGGFGMLDVVFGVLPCKADVSFRILLALVGCSVLLLEYDSVGGFGMLTECVSGWFAAGPFLHCA